MRRSSLLLLALLTGCEKDLLTAMDASVDAAAPDAATVCRAPATDAHPAAAYTVYLNFDGVTLTKGDDDARVDHAQVLTNATAVIPRYLPNETDAVRQGRIDLIVAFVSRALAPYSIDVVTTRPASGDYEMMVLGGDPVTLGYPAGVLSLAPGTCDATNRNHVALEFDVGLNATHEANAILSDLGASVGVAPTTLSCDCMNRFVACPTADSAICTFHDMAMTDPQQLNCGRLPSQDELALLRDAWGCR
jgi:hypothetical protein